MEVQGIAVHQCHAIICYVKQDSFSLMLPDTPTEEMSRTFDVNTAMNLRKLLEEEFPFGLELNELYGAYEVSVQRLLVHINGYSYLLFVILFYFFTNDLAMHMLIYNIMPSVPSFFLFSNAVHVFVLHLLRKYIEEYIHIMIWSVKLPLFVFSVESK